MIKSHSEFRKGQGLTEGFFISSLKVGDKSGTRRESVRRHTTNEALCIPSFPQKLKMLCKNYSCQQNRQLRLKTVMDHALISYGCHNTDPQQSSLQKDPGRLTTGKKITMTQNFDPDTKEYIMMEKDPF